ncbi:CAT RNA binding domain-containing protein [Liquorilactobacillus nagelii]|uniref:CAT RNA binding domain-containing protein n=1 Tax=Liquorilactobacillus nagelii TaxID=82688 RepID=UPI0006F19389|nr:CAT RNA binding domain-containing protein [Liquorilactobacillus nagelii]KRL40996.1 hypothetical protein FD45_GL001649 [Liquorilactobacillus nagelii DSM 13675]
MKIIKIFNNNVVLADQNSHQIVLIGKGLGFQKKPGMTIQSEKLSKFTRQPKVNGLACSMTC